MTIIVDRPPNFEAILKVFPQAERHGVIFAYGEHVFNPSGVVIPPALIAHEAVHQDRQRKQFTPEHWWEMYLTDPGFRYNEEVLSHAAEYRAQVRHIKDRNDRAKLLQATAMRLIAPLYNYLPSRSLNVAITDLRRELHL